MKITKKVVEAEKTVVTTEDIIVIELTREEAQDLRDIHRRFNCYGVYSGKGSDWSVRKTKMNCTLYLSLLECV